jgi:Spy/CpxP family protein refolding chaperone
MKRTLLRVGIVVAGIAAVSIGGIALAARSFGPHAMQRHVAAMIDGTLDAAKADPAQRQAIEAARDQAFATLKGIHGERRAQMKEALAVFEADTLDGARVKAIKDARLGELKAGGDAILGAITTAHDVLRPDQRRLVADYLRSHKPSSQAGTRGAMMKRFASSRIDDLLDEVDATDVQRTAIEAARDHVFAAFDDNATGAHAAMVERALALFSADALDATQVQALRAEHQARAERIGDAVVQAVHDVHDALTPAQRRQVTAEIRARSARFHHHGDAASEG